MGTLKTTQAAASATPAWVGCCRRSSKAAYHLVSDIEGAEAGFIERDPTALAQAPGKITHFSS